MSNEMTAEEYLKAMFMHKFSIEANAYKFKYYGDLRAKEAVKEFAEELMKFIQPLSTSQSITNYVNILLEQKGVKI